MALLLVVLVQALLLLAPGRAQLVRNVCYITNWSQVSSYTYPAIALERAGCVRLLVAPLLERVGACRATG